MKKLLAIFLALICAIALFSCSDEEKPTEEIPPEETFIPEDVIDETYEEVTGEQEFSEMGDLPKISVDNAYKPERLEALVKEIEKEKVTHGQILFYGHSYFAEWTSSGSAGKELKDMIPTPAGRTPALNHSLKGATLYDLCYYYARLVRPWAPKAIVVSAFMNDYLFTTDQEINLLTWLVTQITTDFPDCQVFVTDFIPYPKLEKDGAIAFIERWRIFSGKAKTALSGFPKAKLIETALCEGFYSDKEKTGTMKGLDTSLYKEDLVTLNSKGYEVLAGVYKENLKDVLLSFDS